MPPLFLMRHGESSWNTLGLAQGHNDQARLTFPGQRQAPHADPPASRRARWCLDGRARSIPRESKGAVPSGRTSGESRAAFCNDLDDAIADVVVVVAHGGTLRVLHAYLNGIPVEEMSWEPLENARILRIPDFATR